MADAHIEQNIHDLAEKVDRMEQAWEQIALSAEQYQAQLAEIRQQLTTVARDAGVTLAPLPAPAGPVPAVAPSSTTPATVTTAPVAARVSTPPAAAPPSSGRGSRASSDKDKA